MLTVVLAGGECTIKVKLALVSPDHTVTKGDIPATLGLLLEVITRASRNAGQVEKGTALLKTTVPVTRVPGVAFAGVILNELNVGQPAGFTKIYCRVRLEAVKAST